MQNELEYKKNAKEASSRLNELWSRKGQDKIYAKIGIPSKTLSEFSAANVDGPAEYPDPYERIKFWDSYLKEFQNVEDDSLPIAYLSEFDQGIYAASVGAPIHYMMHAGIGWVSSMAPPILESIEQAEDLKVNPDAHIFEILDKQLKIYQQAAHGKFGIAPFIVLDAMNFVAEMRGATGAFEDVMDHPEKVKKLMDFAFDLNVYIQDKVFDNLDRFDGGSFVNMGYWAKGKPVLFSIDQYHLARADFFYEWGVPHLQKLLNYYDGGLLHIHSNGRHLLKEAINLEGLLGVFMIEEKWSTRSFDELSVFKKDAGEVPLIIPCNKEEFLDGLNKKTLPGNVLYKVYSADSVDEANSIMEKVKEYRV